LPFVRIERSFRSPAVAAHGIEETVSRTGQRMKPFTTIAAILLALMALAHLYRLVRHIDIVLGGWLVPQWVSIVAVIVAGGLAIMLWRESRR